MKTRTLLAIGCVALGATAPAAAQVVEAPSADRIFPFTPERAIREGVSGQAIVRCQVQPDGSLKGCAVVSEAPAGQAFGIASIVAAQRLFKAKPPQVGGQPTVDVPFIWNAR